MSYESNLPTRGRRVIMAAGVAAACCVAVLGLWLWIEHVQKSGLEQEHAQTVAALDQAQTQIHQLNDRLKQMETEQQRLAAQAAVAPTTTNAPEVSPETQGEAPRPSPWHPAKAAVTKRAAVRAPRTDPRIDKLQGELTDTQQQLASTRDELARNKDELDGKINSTRDDLNGSIARTHDDVVALQRRGERNVYEFKLTKSKEMQRVGPLTISLRSTSTKHNTYDLAMVVDDNALNKKHVNLYEPVWVTLSDRPQPVQLVVNHVGKDEVGGYISEPKYRNSELSARTEQAPNPAQPQFATRAQTDDQK